MLTLLTKLIPLLTTTEIALTMYTSENVALRARYSAKCTNEVRR